MVDRVWCDVHGVFESETGSKCPFVGCGLPLRSSVDSLGVSAALAKMGKPSRRVSRVSLPRASSSDLSLDRFDPKLSSLTSMQKNLLAYARYQSRISLREASAFYSTSGYRREALSKLVQLGFLRVSSDRPDVFEVVR